LFRVFIARIVACFGVLPVPVSVPRVAETHYGRPTAAPAGRSGRVAPINGIFD
jgi:hypothetical protein